MNAPAAYLVLGVSGAGRRAVLSGLLPDGLGDGARVALLTAPDEPAPDPAVAAALAAVPGLALGTWSLDPAGRLHAPLAADVTHVFVVADGAADPADQIEAFHGWLGGGGGTLARVLTVVHCALAAAHPVLDRWHDACIHFSDVVFFNHREGAGNAWVGARLARLRKERLPCLVELVRRSGFDNPALLLEPQARRISVHFDAPEDWPDPDDDEGDAPDPGDLVGKPDPWLERLPSGRRVRELPDIRPLLGR